jgi:hypothetical protein
MIAPRIAVCTVLGRAGRCDPIATFVFVLSALACGLRIGNSGTRSQVERDAK